jgi:peptidase E
MKHILMSRGILGNPLFVPHVKPHICSDDKVLIINFSFFNKYLPNQTAYHQYYAKHGEYDLKMVQSFQPYGIKEDQIEWLDYYLDNEQTAKEKIKKANILYFPGGAPDQMMMRIKQFNIKSSIESHQGLLIGSSAGAMIQFKNFHISPDHDYSRFSIQEGLNLIDDFIIEVHFRRRKKQKQAMRKMHQKTKKEIYILPDDGMLIYDNNKIECIHTAKKYYSRKGVFK